MSLIDTLKKEIYSTTEEEVSSKIDSWIKRCRHEGVSIHSLEKLLELRFGTDADEIGPRSMFRFRGKEPLINPDGELKNSSSDQSLNLEGKGKKGFFDKLFGKIGLKK